MRRNQLIEQLIKSGEEEIHRGEIESFNKANNERWTRLNKWNFLLERARAYFDLPVQEAIVIPDEVVQLDFPEQVAEKVYFIIDVVFCAPIRLEFDADFKNPTMTSPKIEYDDENDCLVWVYGTLYGGYCGTRALKTSRLDLALADAARKFGVMEKCLSERALMKKPVNELQYEKIDDQGVDFNNLAQVDALLHRWAVKMLDCECQKKEA